MSRGPAALRPLVMALHWGAALLVVAWLAGRAPGWLLAAHALPWLALTAAFGLRGGPSPALGGPLRRAAHLSHAALLVLYGAGALLAALGLPAARPVLTATLVGAALHGLGNGYRASVLGDGAFRRMLPRALW